MTVIDGLIIEVMDREPRPTALRSDQRLAVHQSAPLKGLAQLLSAALRRMAKKRLGCIACVIRQEQANVNSELCEPAIALIRSAAAEMQYYGISVNAIVVSGSVPAANAPENGTTSDLMIVRAAQLACLLAQPDGAEVRGQAFFLTPTVLALISPPRVKRQLITADRRFVIPELEVLVPMLVATCEQQTPDLPLNVEQA